MGMIGKFAAVPPGRFRSLRRDPAALDAYQYPESGDYPDDVHPDCDFLCVEKLWHALHFVLTGSAWEGMRNWRNWEKLAPVHFSEGKNELVPVSHQFPGWVFGGWLAGMPRACPVESHARLYTGQQLIAIGCPGLAPGRVTFVSTRAG